MPASYRMRRVSRLQLTCTMIGWSVKNTWWVESWAGPAGNQYHQQRLFLTIFNICRFTENPAISFRDVLKSFTPFGEIAIECFKRDNHREFVCLEIVSAYYQSCIWKKKLNSNLKLSSNSNPRLQNLSRWDWDILKENCFCIANILTRLLITQPLMMLFKDSSTKWIFKSLEKPSTFMKSNFLSPWWESL